MQPIPYLHFRGDCAEALAFYADVFDAPPPRLMRYSDAPPGAEVPPSERVMHGQLTLEGGALMASDFPEGMTGDPQRAVSVMAAVADVEAGRRIFRRLCEGGAEIIPFGPTFWSSGFGMVKDRFGTHWMRRRPRARGLRRLPFRARPGISGAAAGRQA